MEGDIRKDEQMGESEKKPYDAPLVTDLGNVAELTKGGGGGSTDSQASA